MWNFNFLPRGRGGETSWQSFARTVDFCGSKKPRARAKAAPEREQCAYVTRTFRLSVESPDSRGAEPWRRYVSVGFSVSLLFKTGNLCIIVYRCGRHPGGWVTESYDIRKTRSRRSLEASPRVYFARRYYTVSFHGRRRKKEVGNPGSLNLERTTNDAPRVLARAPARVHVGFYDSRRERVRFSRRYVDASCCCVVTLWKFIDATLVFGLSNSDSLIVSVAISRFDWTNWRWNAKTRNVKKQFFYIKTFLYVWEILKVIL